MRLHDNREKNQKADNLFKEKHEITLIFKNQMKTKSQNIKMFWMHQKQFFRQQEGLMNQTLDYNHNNLNSFP